MGSYVETIKSKSLLRLGNFELKLWHVGALVVGWFVYSKFLK